MGKSSKEIAGVQFKLINRHNKQKFMNRIHQKKYHTSRHLLAHKQCVFKLDKKQPRVK